MEVPTWSRLQDPAIAAKYDAGFRRLFPDGHRSSLRQMLEQWREPRPEAGGMACPIIQVDEMHPRALSFLLEHGRDYVPEKWTMRPVREPAIGECFANSLALMHTHDYVYVEGLAAGALVNLMHHAWNAETISSLIAKDWTHYVACHWSRYFGCAFTYDEYKRIAQACTGREDSPIAIFHSRYFPTAEPLVRDILASRRKNTDSHL